MSTYIQNKKVVSESRVVLLLQCFNKSYMRQTRQPQRKKISLYIPENKF